MRVLVLNADYPAFLDLFYGAQTGLSEAPYSVQMNSRNASLFGVADFYSWNLRALGHDAAEVHVNNLWLQTAWARQRGKNFPLPPPPKSHNVFPTPSKNGAFALLKPYLRPIMRYVRQGGMSALERNILAMQIEEFQPDVVLNHDMTYVPNEFLRGVCPVRTLVIGQIAARLPENKNFDAYKLVISSLPSLVDWFRGHGVRAEINRLAFEPRVLQALGNPPVRDIDVSFVGSLSSDHGSRIEFLEHLARHVPLRVWGTGIEKLPRSSPLWRCYEGVAWGRDMYNVLRRSRITINHHIDLAGSWANNMRLYEATGMGSLLLTDRKSNLSEIFIPGREVADYGSPQECVDQITRFLSEEDNRVAVAAAGQQRAIDVENYSNRMREFLELVSAIDLPREFQETTQ